MGLAWLATEEYARTTSAPVVTPMPAGQIVGRITEVRPVADVMADLIKEADQTLDRLRNLR